MKVEIDTEALSSLVKEYHEAELKDLEETVVGKYHHPDDLVLYMEVIDRLRWLLNNWYT